MMLQNPDDIPASAQTKNLRWCYFMLNKTSRSFAFVIRELGGELRDAVCLFYLVLRALDTVEDDMSFGAEEKAEVLRQFHERLYTPGWTFTRCGEGFEKTLLVE